MPPVRHRGSGGGRPCRTGLPHREIRGASRPGGGTSALAVVFLVRYDHGLAPRRLACSRMRRPGAPTAALVRHRNHPQRRQEVRIDDGGRDESPALTGWKALDW